MEGCGEIKSQISCGMILGKLVYKYRLFFCGGCGSSVKEYWAAHFSKIATVQKPRQFKCGQGHKTKQLNTFTEKTASF